MYSNNDHRHRTMIVNTVLTPGTYSCTATLDKELFSSRERYSCIIGLKSFFIDPGDKLTKEPYPGVVVTLDYYTVTIEFTTEMIVSYRLAVVHPGVNHVGGWSIKCLKMLNPA